MSSPDSARDNIVTPMKRLGLIDDDGVLTELGNKWRVDASYADACDEIIELVYPDDLAALTNGDGEPDAEQVKTWFDHKGFGDSNARNMANTYILIARKDVPDPPANEPAKKAAPKKSSKAAKTTPPKAPESPSLPETITTPATTPPATTQTHDGPSLHIDIQIHIPADADPDQIDQIFASMAKHLYPQRAGE